MYAETDLNDTRKTYLGMVSQVDDTIGQVVQALKVKGMYENSVIIFQSDVSAGRFSICFHIGMLSKYYFKSFNIGRELKNLVF